MGREPLTYDVDRVRARIPALADGTAYFDGPGGTQMPDVVADAMVDVLKAGVSNRGSVTAAEQRAEATVVAARMAGADLVNADPAGIVFGRSMTELTFEVARTLAQDWGPGDEVVVTRLDHDANIRPWVTYAQRTGATVRWAPFDPQTGVLDPADVLSLVNGSTRVVAVTGASNLLGTRPDLVTIGNGLADSEALFYVDGVHLTAHAPIDMRALGADFYACSPYKFLGPHCGMLAASPALLETMHPDKLRPSTEQVPERFELGTLPYELLAGVDAAVDFLADLVPGGVERAERPDSRSTGEAASMSRRDRLVRSMTALEAYEDALRDRLREGLESIAGVHLHGHAPMRTPTELFSVDGMDAQDVYRSLARAKVNAPAGSFYAIEASEWLGLGSRGAVRAGLAPYTNADDVDRLLDGVAGLSRS